MADGKNPAVRVCLNREGCTASLVRKPAEKEIVHTPEEYDFPGSLYQEHWEGAEAWGVVSDAGEMITFHGND